MISGQEFNHRALDWSLILEKLQSLATSEHAREELRETKPFASISAAEKSLEQIFEAQFVLATSPRPQFSSLDLCSTWIQRLSRKAVLKTLELKDVRHFCLDTLSLITLLESHHSPWCVQWKAGLLNAAEPLSAIDSIISPTGEIHSDASEKLYNLTREKSENIKQVQSILDRYAKANEMESILQDRYVTTREGRWVLPVRSGMQHTLGGIIHGTSQTKQTVYMEPQEVVPLNNRLRQVEAEIEDEIERILTELSQYLAGLCPQFSKTKLTLESVDVVFAKAQLTELLQAKPCKFLEMESDDENGKKLILHQVRHPLLILNSVPVIPNSVELDSKKRILLLSGPNAGGKTVLLKSVGLACHMARCGLPICADEGSTIPFFKQIFVAVGDSQSVDAQLSTFAAHLKILNSALSASGPNDLVLIDEICGATDPEEGTALARAFIESYSANKCFGVITSHLSGLKLGWDEHAGITNGSLDFDAERGPTYHFVMGIPGQSLALKTAKRVGVSLAVLERAYSYLSPGQQAYQKGIDEIETMRLEMENIRRSLQSEILSTRKSKEEYDSLRKKIELDSQKAVADAVKKAETQINQMLEKTKVDQTFRKHENLLKLKSQLPELVKSTPPSAVKIETVEDFLKAFPAGSRVFVPLLNRDGVIQGRANAKGEIPIFSQSMQLLVHWAELKAPQQAKNSNIEILRKGGSHTLPLSTDEDPVLDIRGKNLDEALGSLERALDQAAVRQEDRLKIIHGHGTDTLKRSVRSFLSKSVYVKKWIAGSPESGGDGITWVEIKD